VGRLRKATATTLRKVRLAPIGALGEVAVGEEASVLIK